MGETETSGGVAEEAGREERLIFGAGADDGAWGDFEDRGWLGGKTVRVEGVEREAGDETAAVGEFLGSGGGV